MPDIQGTLVVVDATGVVVEPGPHGSFVEPKQVAAQLNAELPEGKTAYDVSLDPSAVDPAWVDRDKNPSFQGGGVMHYDPQSNTLRASTAQERADTAAALDAIRAAQRLEATKGELTDGDSFKRFGLAVIAYTREVERRMRAREPQPAASADVAFFRGQLRA